MESLPSAGLPEAKPEKKMASLPSTGLPANYEQRLRESELQAEFQREEQDRRRRQREKDALDKAQRENDIAENRRIQQKESEKARLDKAAADLKRKLQAQRDREEAEFNKSAEKAADEYNRDAEKKAKKEKELEDKMSKAFQKTSDAKKKKLKEAEAAAARIKAQQAARDQAEAEQAKARARQQKERADESDREILRRSKDLNERIKARQRMEGREKEFRRQQSGGAKTPGARQPITPTTIRNAIGQSVSGTGPALDRMVTGLFGGAAASMTQPRTFEQGKQAFKHESKALSGAVRNKELGKNPFLSVIGVSGQVSQMYQTDGHGRSGKRATLEWRRAHRNYQNPQREAAASINKDWIANVTGTKPEPVRHRKVPAGSKKQNPVDRYVNSLF